MRARRRWAIEWPTAAGLLRAHEPGAADVQACAARLADFYNHPHNRQMMTNSGEMSADEVIAHYAALEENGGRPFLLERDGVLVGDADLRRVTAADAEVAILIGQRAQQGQGLGQHFGIMLHVFAFEVLRLKRVYAAIIPDNAASLRLFEKLGHEVDASPDARRYADDPSDITTSVSGHRFGAVVKVDRGAMTFVSIE